MGLTFWTYEAVNWNVCSLKWMCIRLRLNLEKKGSEFLPKFMMLGGQKLISMT